MNEWQITEIRAALKEADAGDFATEAEVEAVRKKWRRGAGQWLRRVLRSLDEEADYLAHDNPQAAAQVVEHIAASVGLLLASQPSAGPATFPAPRADDNGHPIRRSYRVHDDAVEILRVFGAKR